MRDDVRLSTYAEHLHTTFHFAGGEAPGVEVTLVEAVDSGSTPRQTRFSLLFRGPADVALEQRTYRVEHPALGAFDLFVVPVGVDADGRLYEASFNLVHEARRQETPPAPE